MNYTTWARTCKNNDKARQEFLKNETGMESQAAAGKRGNMSGQHGERERPPGLVFPGCASGRSCFLHRDHHIALSWGNPRQNRERLLQGGRGEQEN